MSETTTTTTTAPCEFPQPSLFAALVPNVNGRLCDEIARAGEFDVQFYNFYVSMFTEDGEHFTQCFKDLVCGLQCATTTTVATTTTTTTGA